jgi:hypothetical protein
MDAQYKRIISHLNDIIKKKDEIIKEKDLYINQLKEEISQMKSNSNSSSYNYRNNSQLRPGINCLSNPPSHIKKDDGALYCMLVMNDKRIAVGGSRGELMIYNIKTLNRDITINEHNNCWIVHLFQLKNGNIVSTAYKNGINIIKLYQNNEGYEVIQKINFTGLIAQTIELKNLQLAASICYETKLKLYSIDNHLYNLNCEIDLKSNIRHLLEIKENEVAVIKESNTLDIIDIQKRSIKRSINDIKFTVNDCSDILCLLSNNILAIGGSSLITLVDIDSYLKIREIAVENSGQIYSILKFTDKIIITGDHLGNLKQWTFDEESQNLNKTSFIKDKVHSSIVRYCLKINNSSFATCSDDTYLKIWEI